MSKLESYQTIWIDLTDFMDWKGHFTGIQRVEYELASRFAKRKNVKFFFYHPIKGSFIETSFDPIVHKAKVASGEIKLTSKEEARQVRASKRLSQKMKEAIPHDARMRLVKIKGKLQQLRESSPFEIAHPFEENDLMLVLGGNWAFATFMPSLEKIKQGIKGLKSVHVLYDFIPVLYPAFFPLAMEKSYEKYIKKVLEQSNFSLAISENTKKDAYKYAENNGIKPNKVTAFRLGDDFVKIPPEKPDEVDVNGGDFIFCVGTFEIRKNHQLFYYAIKLAKEKGIGLPKVIIVGKKGWLSDTTMHLFKLDNKLKDSIKIMHRCSDKEMAWLYENCMFTVYPSYYEGWGLPIAESLSYGKMCLASSSSSMPEVGGDLIDYFSPFDSGEFVDKINQYLDKKKLKKAEEKIKKNYKKTTWDDTYKQVQEIIEREL